MAKQKKRANFLSRHKKLVWSIGILLAIVIAIMIAFKVSPWPGAMLIRGVFNADSSSSKKALEKHTPSQPVTVLSNQQYDPQNKDLLLDVYFPQGVENKSTELPVIIWTHGGAWISGGKDDYSPYFKLLAAEGFTVVVPNYSLAPGAVYPTPLKQLSTVYTFLQANRQRFHANSNSIFLAGDSAGSQISSQMAAIITNPPYAKEVGITPTLSPADVKGIILFCGIYKMHGLTQPPPDLPKIIGWGDDIAVWSYAGTKDFTAPVIGQMSPYYHVTSSFPPTFISGGNADPLTEDQSKPFADKLQTLGVPTTSRFFPKDHQPQLPHEYQFNLDNEDGTNALKAMTDFIHTRLK